MDSMTDIAVHGGGTVLGGLGGAGFVGWVAKRWLGSIEKKLDVLIEGQAEHNTKLAVLQTRVAELERRVDELDRRRKSR